MGDIRCPKSVDIDLNEENGCVNHWFRSESELQNEGKGGFLCGKIRIKGIDETKECVRKFRLSLVSNHVTQLHCNLLRIGLNSFHKMYHRREDNAQGADSAMPPTAYSVVLSRVSDDRFKIDLSNHGYLQGRNNPDEFREVAFWDESTQTLTLGEKGSHNNRSQNGSTPEKESGLCLTIVKPLSKQEQKGESSKGYCHIRRVLMKIKEEEILNILDGDINLTRTQKDKELKKRMNEFTKNELNEDSCATKRKKDRTKNLETTLAETEMHKAQLKVEVYIGPKHGVENNNNELEQVESTSKWILASNRYGFKISSSTNAVILNDSSIWLLTVYFDTCKITSKMPIDAQFLYRDSDHEEEICPDEIEILPINGKTVCRDKLGQVALQIFLRTNSGHIDLDTKYNWARRSGTEYGLYLRLRVLDESGYVGAEDVIKVSCEPHDCLYDQQLSKEDAKFGKIIENATIERWLTDGTLTHQPCPLCRVFGKHARSEYVQKQSSSSLGSKRRFSHHGGDSDSGKKFRTTETNGLLEHRVARNSQNSPRDNEACDTEVDNTENLNSGIYIVSTNPQFSAAYGTSFHNQTTINEAPTLDYVLPPLDSSLPFHLVDTSVSQSNSSPSSDIQYNPSISPSSGFVDGYQVSENPVMQLPHTNHEQTAFLNHSSSSSLSPGSELANFSNSPNTDIGTFDDFGEIDFNDLVFGNGEYQQDAVPIRKIEPRNLDLPEIRRRHVGEPTREREPTAQTNKKEVSVRDEICELIFQIINSPLTWIILFFTFFYFYLQY